MHPWNILLLLSNKGCSDIININVKVMMQTCPWVQVLTIALQTSCFWDMTWFFASWRMNTQLQQNYPVISKTCMFRYLSLSGYFTHSIRFPSSGKFVVCCFPWTLPLDPPLSIHCVVMNGMEFLLFGSTTCSSFFTCGKNTGWVLCDCSCHS